MDHPLTYKEALPKVYAWFSRPNAVFGMNEKDHFCVYRGEGDVKSEIRCGIGCLIEDKDYKKRFEGTGVLALFNNQELSLILDIEDYLGFSRLQDQHDRSARNGEFKEFVNWLREECEREGVELGK